MKIFKSTTQNIFSNCGICFIISLIFLSYNALFAQNPVEKQDSLTKVRSLLEETKVQSANKDIDITIRNVDISKFPEIKVIVEASNKFGEPLDSLNPKNLTIVENGKEKKVISAEKISMKERVPLDIVFIIDITGSMGSSINEVKGNVYNFANKIIRKGIDYRLGLILFSDTIDYVFQPTENVSSFLDWMNKAIPSLGGDEKENALEALKQATKLNFRPAANRLAVLITDAPYHQLGEHGDGTTDQTTSSAIKLLNDCDLRVFCITPEKLVKYSLISQKTRGKAYDINYPFATILDVFSNQITNQYALKYRSEEPALPDSINIAILNERKQELVRKIIPIVELGRKLIIENLLYATNSFELPDTVLELEVLLDFMKSKPNVVILVEGHTDNVGTNTVNDALSLRRAESVKRYLIRKGIEQSRIQTKGYGKRKPLADNSTLFGKKLNRRTEIVIVSK